MQGMCTSGSSGWSRSHMKVGLFLPHSLTRLLPTPLPTTCPCPCPSYEHFHTQFTLTLHDLRMHVHVLAM